MIKVALLGASGYGGAEILRIMHTHGGATINYVGGNTQTGQAVSASLGHFKGFYDTVMQNVPLEEIALQHDCIIAATPHNFLAHIITEEILKQCVIIDLSADFRLKDSQKYNEYYAFNHPNPMLLQSSAYGLCEINRDSIRNANLIANPGCYPTCSTLAIAPLLRHGIIDAKSIIIDAKSGVSGAGRSLKIDNIFCEVNENIKAYGLVNHRHTAEIEQNLSMIADTPICISFTPHLIPMNRGILVTAYANLQSSYKSMTQKDIDTLYKESYQDEIFIRVLEDGMPPEVRWVNGGNFADISVRLDSRNNRVIMMGAIDNLIKGAAGQAVQNFNIRFGFDEKTALSNLALFP